MPAKKKRRHEAVLEFIRYHHPWQQDDTSAYIRANTAWPFHGSPTRRGASRDSLDLVNSPSISPTDLSANFLNSVSAARAILSGFSPGLLNEFPQADHTCLLNIEKAAPDWRRLMGTIVRSSQKNKFLHALQGDGMAIPF